MKKHALLLFCAMLLLSSPAAADWTGKNAGGGTITFKNPGDCTVVVCVPETQIVDAAGVSVSPATSANQTTINTSIGTTNTNLGAQADTAAAADNSTASLIALLKRTNQNLTTLNGTAAAAVPAGTSRIGYTSDDPCNNASVKVYTPINVVTATNVIIAGVSAKKKYVCSIFLYPAGTDNVAIYQATTGTSCATALVAILGGTTTTTGFQMTAQAGFVVGNGVSSVAATTVVNTDICVTTSAAVQLSGVVVTADQ